MIFLAPLALAACLTLPRGAANVTAADLHLEGLPPGTVLSYAPMPGSQRVFHLPELRQISARFHLAAIPEDDLCVERVTAPLDGAQLLAAMQKELPEARIEILEVSRQAAPEGEILFRRAGLRNNASGAIWFGAVRYAPNREFTIWAKVRVAVHAQRIVAVTDLRPGSPIGGAQVKLETADDFPSTEPLVASLDETVGHYPRALIPAGAAIRLGALEAPRDVRQGDTVEVEVASGNMRLRFEGRAAGSGSIGATIPILNPASSKRFEARIEAKGKVLVEAK